jgi:hypothetical protein
MATVVTDDPVIILRETPQRTITTYPTSYRAALDVAFFGVVEKVARMSDIDTAEQAYDIACGQIDRLTAYLNQRVAEYYVPERAAATIHDEAYIAARATRVVDLARAQNFVLTVEQVPLQPLAMGNYETVVSVRPVRNRS